MDQIRRVSVTHLESTNHIISIDQLVPQNFKGTHDDVEISVARETQTITGYGDQEFSKLLLNKSLAEFSFKPSIIKL